MTGLRATAFASVRWTAAAMMVRAGLALAQLMVLAKLVPPEAFGVLAIALALQNIALGLSDMGLSSAIVSMPELDAAQRASLFWITIAAGLTLSLALFLATPAIAGLFDAEQLAPIVALGCWVIFASSLGSQFRALGEKRLQFGVLARIETLSACFGFALTLIMAITGMGVIAVPAGALIAALANSVLAWHWLAKGWRPVQKFALAPIRSHLRFGLNVVLTGFANLAGQQADVLVAGRMVSAGALGFYFPAREIGMRAIFLVNPVVTRVGLPLIVHARSERHKVAEIYRLTVLMTTSVCFPVYGALAVLAPQIVVLALGESWSPTAPLLQAVAVWCALRAIGNPLGSLLIGVGMTGRGLISSALVTVLVIAFAFAGARWGGMGGVPWALAALYLGLIVPMWFWLVRPACGLGFWSYHLQVIRPALCAALASMAAWLAISATDSDLVSLCLGVVSGGIVYLLASVVINREWVGAMSELLVARPRRFAA